MKRRDLELLSAYLDGELKPSDSLKLEKRLKTDPELVSVLSDLRATRTLLRKLPKRKAPRSFTLTRKMVGQNPPLPRSYPIFRLATVVATLLFFFSFGINSFSSQMAQPVGFGMGGGGGAAESLAEQAPAEEPAAAAPMAPAPAEPSSETSPSGEEPPVLLAPQGTEIPPAEDAMRAAETPSSKDAEGENMVESQPSQVAQETPRVIPYAWQIGLAGVAMLGLLLMGLTRRFSARRWK